MYREGFGVGGVQYHDFGMDGGLVEEEEEVEDEESHQFDLMMMDDLP